MPRGAVEQSGPLLDARRHRFDLRLDDSDMNVRGDPVRMAQILANLLNNAAKYTHEGGHIELHARREGSKASVMVRDNGAGIAEEMSPSWTSACRVWTLASWPNACALIRGPVWLRRAYALWAAFIGAASEQVSRGNS